MPDDATSKLGLFSAGVLHTLWLTLEMLDEKGLLSREESHAWLSEKLQQSSHRDTQLALPLAQLVAFLGRERPPGGWSPTVYQGGRADEPSEG